MRKARTEHVRTRSPSVGHVFLRRGLVCSPKASNIDDVLGHHTGFLDTCLKDCMLTNPELLKVFSKLMSVCVMFTNCMQVRGVGGTVGWADRIPTAAACSLLTFSCPCVGGGAAGI